MGIRFLDKETEKNATAPCAPMNYLRARAADFTVFSQDARFSDRWMKRELCTLMRPLRDRSFPKRIKIGVCLWCLNPPNFSRCVSRSDNSCSNSGISGGCGAVNRFLPRCGSPRERSALIEFAFPFFSLPHAPRYIFPAAPLRELIRRQNCGDT